MCLLTLAEDFRGRLSDNRAVLELFQKAVNELEHVMEGVYSVDDTVQRLCMGETVIRCF